MNIEIKECKDLVNAFCNKIDYTKIGFTKDILLSNVKNFTGLDNAWNFNGIHFNGSFPKKLKVGEGKSDRLYLSLQTDINENGVGGWKYS